MLCIGQRTMWLLETVDRFVFAPSHRAMINHHEICEAAPDHDFTTELREIKTGAFSYVVCTVTVCSLHRAATVTNSFRRCRYARPPTGRVLTAEISYSRWSDLTLTCCPHRASPPQIPWRTTAGSRRHLPTCVQTLTYADGGRRRRDRRRYRFNLSRIVFFCSML